jgi:PAS domain S-box-containing protein
MDQQSGSATNPNSLSETHLASGATAEAILALISDPIVEIDSHFRVRYLNPAAERILLAPGGDRSNLWTRLAHHFGLPFEAAVRSAMESRSPAHLPIAHSIGEFWFDGNALPVSAGGLILHFRDVSKFRVAESPALTVRAVSGQELEMRVAERTIQLSEELDRRALFEQTLEANQEFIEAVLENIESGIAACDENGTLKLFNRATRELHGLPETPIPADKWAEYYSLYYPDGKTRMRTEDIPLHRAFSGEVVRNAELVVEQTNGAMRTVLSSGRALFNRAGRKLGAVVAMHDITHRKQANRRVRLALSRFRALFDQAPIPYHEIDRNGLIRRVNRAECRLLGRKREEMMGRPIWDFVAVEERHASREAVLLKVGGSLPLKIFERDYITSAGNRLTLEIHEELIRDEAGRIDGIRTAMLDVTARLHSEEQRRLLTIESMAREQAQASREEIKAMLDRIGDAYMVFDKDWRYVYVNRKAAELALRPAEDLIGKCVWEEFPESVYTSFYTELRRAFRDQVSVHFENFYAPLEKCFENTVYPNPEGVSVFYRDVTERKVAQDELAQKTEDLARSNQELEQFAYAVSHDLQEPLRMVESYTTLLARRYSGKLDDQADEFIGYAVEGANRMRQMIQDLLAYCRVGHSDAGPRKVDMAAAVAMALRNLSTGIAESGATVLYENLPTLDANETQIVQVLQNLIGNAIKYRGTEPPRIVVTAERMTSEWKFSISDNGIGFDMRNAGRIFQVFKRLHSSDQPGAGVGLAICKKIVERRHGRIWAESKPGHGSTFCFTIPDLHSPRRR